MVDRCVHDAQLLHGLRRDYLAARSFVRMKLPHAQHYLVTTFFWPPLRKRRTTLVPSLLRPEILAAAPENGDHLLVYGRISQTSIDAHPRQRRDGAPVRRARRPDRRRTRGQPAVPAVRQRGVRRRPAHLPRRGRLGRVLADERGGLPAQADAGAAAGRPVRAGDERPLPGAAGVRHRRDGAGRGRAGALPGARAAARRGARPATSRTATRSRSSWSTGRSPSWRRRRSCERPGDRPDAAAVRVGAGARRHRDRDRGRLRLGRAPAHLVPQAGVGGRRLRPGHGRPAADRLPRVRLRDPDAGAAPAVRVRRRLVAGRRAGHHRHLLRAGRGLGLPVVRAQPGVHGAPLPQGRRLVVREAVDRPVPASTTTRASRCASGSARWAPGRPAAPTCSTASCGCWPGSPC